MKKIDLNDVTFMIPVKIDCPERKRNLNYTLEYLTRNFETNIIILEADVSEQCEYVVDDYKNYSGKISYGFQKLEEHEPFHRTKYLNHMIIGSDTPIVVNYDADVLLPKESYVEAVNLIKNKNVDLVYPYQKGEHQFRVYLDKIDKDKISSFIEKFPFSLKPEYCHKHIAEYGFCQFVNRQSYFDAGLENECFISWGPEDYERYHRFKLFGFKIDRCGSAVFHMEHPAGKDSSPENPFFIQNSALLDAISLLEARPLFFWLLQRKYMWNHLKAYPDLFSYSQDVLKLDKNNEQQIKLSNNWSTILESRIRKKSELEHGKK